MKWYKRDPDAFFAATRALSLEERGAYNDLLDMLYARDGNVPDDDRLMSRNLCCDPRTWRKLKASLIAAGKVRVEDGKLTANRVNSELSQAQLRLSEMSRLGRVSAEIRKKRKQNNGGPPTAPLVTTTTTTREEESAAHAASGNGKESKGQPTKADEERDLYRRGKQVLGGSSGGQIVRLVKVKDGSVAQARATIETASTKQNPREYVARVIHRLEERPQDNIENFIAL